MSGYSAAELAGLPGMPSDERGVQVKANRQGWPYEEQKGRNKSKRIYPLSCLPAVTQAYFFSLEPEKSKEPPSNSGLNHSLEQSALDLNLSACKHVGLTPQYENFSRQTSLPTSIGGGLQQSIGGTANPTAQSGPDVGRTTAPGLPNLPTSIGGEQDGRESLRCDAGPVLGGGLRPISQTLQHFSNGYDISVPTAPAGSYPGASTPSRGVSLETWGHFAETQDRALIKRIIIEASTEYCRTQPRLVDCLGEFTAACNAGGLGIPLWVRVAFPELRSRTLHKWRCDYQKNGLDGLRDKRTGGDTKTEIDANQVLQERILGLMQSAPHAPVAQLYKILGREFENLPHLATVQRWVTRWKEANPVTWAYLINPDKAKGKYQASYGDMSAGIERLYQQFEMDASPSDVRCRDGRYALLACIDVWSRRVRVLVSKTSSSQGQCTLLRQVFTQWGLPELIKTDNGKDYISERIVSVCHDLGIERKPCPRFTPEGKPHVESFFRTLSHSYLFELSKGFVGHNVGQAQAIRSQQTFASRFMNGKDQELEVDLTAAELQERLDRWIAHEYDHSAHSGLAGLTPFQRYSSYVGSVRREDPRKLDILLTEAPPTSGKGAGIRTVGKEGISAWGLTWIAAELPQWTGQEVRVRRDDLDQGRVLVFDLAWNFLCICQPAEGMAAVERQEIAVKARKLHKKLVNAAKATLKKHVAGADIVAGALNLAQQENSGLVAFPTPGFSYETAALAAAGAAVEALEQAKAPMAKTQPLPPEIQASYEQARAPKATRYTDAEFWSWTPGEMFLNLRHVPEAEMTEKQARWMREMAPNHPAVLGILQLEARLRR